jgi:hypothetical protein
MANMKKYPTKLILFNVYQDVYRKTEKNLHLHAGPK